VGPILKGKDRREVKRNENIIMRKRNKLQEAKVSK